MRLRFRERDTWQNSKNLYGSNILQSLHPSLVWMQNGGGEKSANALLRMLPSCSLSPVGSYFQTFFPREEQTTLELSIQVKWIGSNEGKKEEDVGQQPASASKMDCQHAMTILAFIDIIPRILSRTWLAQLKFVLYIEAESSKFLRRVR